MNKELPGSIKDFLNSVSANNQVIGVNLALQNGYTAEDVALYVLNTSTGWSKRTFNPARNLIIITCKKSFLGKRITTRAKFHTEEPLESEIYIRLGRWHRGSIYRQRGAEKPYYPERTEALMLDGLVKLIKSEIFEPA